jgi:hypothetical protein
MPKEVSFSKLANFIRFGLPTVGTFAGVLASTAPAIAGDLFEIQVYEAEVNRPLQFGLEAHVNYTVRGQKHPSYEGEQTPDRVGRLTLEPALGVTEYLELGAYLQNLLDADGRYHFSGWKLRTKWVLPRRYSGSFFFGLNAEVGKVPHFVEQEGWANEFRPIAGYYNGYWLFDINPIFGYALSGRDKFRPDFEPAGKIAYNTQYGFMVGAEYYAGLGRLSSLPTSVSEQEHLIFATIDFTEPAFSSEQTRQAEQPDNESWEMNVGIGRGLTDSTPQKWIIKTILGKSF